jgi:hypothetical protein
MTAVLVRLAPRPAPEPPDAAPRVEARTRPTAQREDIVDQWGVQSFPASDPPSNW